MKRSFSGAPSGHCLLLSIVLSCLFFLSLPAAEKEEKPDVEEKIEVIGRVPLVRALQSVSLLDRERIEAAGTDGLKGLLGQCPGMLVLNAGNPAQFAYGFARGAAVNQMLYLVDGVKLHDPSSALAGNYSFLAPQLIEKVEVVRGPLSNLYGSSAMGGVINVITRRTEGLRFSLSGGSHGTLGGNVHFGKRLGAVHVSLGGDLLDYDEGLANDRFERRSFSLHSGYENNDLSLGLSCFGTLIAAGIPWNLGAATPRRAYEQDNFIVALPLNARVGRRGRLDVTGSLHWNRYDFSDPDDQWTPQFANESFMAELQAKYSARLGEKLNLVAGADLSLQRIAASENHQALIPSAGTEVVSAYAELQADLGRMLLAGSLRFDKYAALEGVLSPHVGLSWNLAPALKLRASFSRSFRAPALPEKLNPYWGNPGLSPETGRSLEAGADLYVANLECGITAFASMYSNLIGFSPLTARFANINQADIRGVEASLGWRVGRGLHWRAAYTYLHTQDVQYERELLRRPRHVLSSAILYRLRAITLSAEVAYVGRRLDYDELLWTVAESRPFSHVAGTLKLPLLKNMTASCRVDNALNARFEEVLGYPAPRRRFMLGLAYGGGD
ncbi:MAG: TonB-dependent receptor [Acidobacteria bacterium]|nr:TonB-dependent receptor [Acidobacteriota bacterium]